METSIDWAKIGRELATPLDPEAVEWRPSGKPGPNQRVKIVAYVSARVVEERLDTVVGVGGWSFELEPLVVAGDELRVARGRLSIYGVAKDDIGRASNWEPSKGCASDALKRAAVKWGIGRYLYNLPCVSVTLDAQGHIPEAMLAKLRERLALRTAS